MKKLVLAMACVLSLGLLASCKQGTQDVNLKNQEKSQSFEYKGTVTVSATLVQTSDDGKSYVSKSVTPMPSLSGSEYKGFATLTWGTSYDTRESNYTEYTLKFYTEYNSGATNATTQYNDVSTLTFYKIGDNFYYDNYKSSPTATGKVKLDLPKGKPGDSEFTISSLGYISSNSETWKIENLKFVKATK